jgi:hypothetical protein
MSRLWARRRGIAAAERGRIIQRILVDGWSTAEAAAALGLREREVARWVADYRRRGMASLHQDAAAEGICRRWGRRLRLTLGRGAGGLRRGFGLAEPAACVELRRTGDKGSSSR